MIIKLFISLRSLRGNDGEILLVFEYVRKYNFRHLSQ